MKLAKANIPDQLKSFQHLLEIDLAKMDALINNLISEREKLIFDISDYLIFSGGKRLRPILTIICSKLINENNDERHIALAAAVELIHTATLLHDDVVDISSLRRGNKTANEKWGNKESILVGDFLLSGAFRLMVKDGSLKILDILSSASAVIAEGEVMQIVATNNIAMTKEEYIKIISAKTAELFASACQVGAVVTSLPLELEMDLRKFGFYLGIAFQILDDMLDYSAKQQELGKSIGDDFREGKITLPIIIAYEKSDPLDREFLVNTMCRLNQTDGDLEKAIGIIHKSNGLEESGKIAKEYIKLAESHLASFPPSDAKDALNTILQYSLERSY
ncbi:Octaprenyl-diphosphate synthase [Candidatus Arcanobacter lacustris]|uniref:Octaprenyl-diphosphate synthase n=1 Tax=Candidatus Arcanibacter lacustris TaxID=1607817 RepID=A0A0F5MPX4_9RICK|nr:Octaprenyl-diphosphate synthase [Candidatus Arcanobacter lacustris]